jgi:hypothetical protein
MIPDEFVQVFIQILASRLSPWGFAVVIGFCLYRYPRFRKVVFRALQVAVILLVVLCAAYCLFCHRTGQLRSVPDGRDVTVVGRVESLCVAADGRSKFCVADPTGRTTVVTESGAPPQEGRYVLVKGRKGTFVGGDGQPHVFIVSEALGP